MLNLTLFVNSCLGTYSTSFYDSLLLVLMGAPDAELSKTFLISKLQTFRSLPAMLPFMIGFTCTIICCCCSRTSAELKYHSLVLEIYSGLVLRRDRLTNNFVETICHPDVLKDCNFKFVDRN